MLSERAVTNIDYLKYIPFEILDFWKNQINDKNELDIYLSQNVMYYAIDVKPEHKRDGYIYINRLLAYTTPQGKIFYLLNKEKRFDFLLPKIIECDQKEMLRLIKLKAFL